LKITQTKKGYPAVWESGGGATNTGEATIVASPDGSPKKPVYIRKRGSLCCSEHALFIVHIGDMVVEANHHRRDFTILVKKIVEIEKNENGEYSISSVPIASFDNGEWDNEEVKQKYSAAIDAAMEKATCYHCREPHYIAADEEVRTE